MKRENKTYSYQEQIIELELQEVQVTAAAATNITTAARAGSHWTLTLILPPPL